MFNKKVKIFLTLPLTLFIIAGFFYFFSPAKAATTCTWWYKTGTGIENCASTGRGTNQDPTSEQCTSVPKTGECLSKICVCCCKEDTLAPAAATGTLNATMPKLQIPDVNLQVKIPGLNLTKGSAIKCTEVNGVKSCDVPWIDEYIAGIYKYAIGIVGILAAIVLMIGGVIWIVAGGSATMIGEAKAWIGASLAGLLIALCSYAILYQVNPALVAYKGLYVGQAQDIKSEDIKYSSGGGQMGTSVIPSDAATRDFYDAFLKTSGYDCTLLKAIMFAESSGRPNVTSPKGAVGLMQLMPATAQSLGISGNLYDPQTNINAGAKYLNQLTTTACNGAASKQKCNTTDIKYIIAAYNGGPQANKESVTCPGQTYWECEANSGYAETRKYVVTVTANLQSLKNNGGACQ